MINQHIMAKGSLSPEEAVSRFCGMQGQDYQNSLWAVGLRSRSGTTLATVEDAIERRKIVRTWLNRGTLHLAHGKDARWMMDLFSPGLARTASIRDSHLGLADTTVKSIENLFSKALQEREMLTRKEMYRLMEDSGIKTRSNNIGYHMLYRAAWDRLICFGPEIDGEQTFVLMNRWIPDAAKLERKEAVSELARRYFTSHGPANARDFSWWSGLTMKEIRPALEENSTGLESESAGKNTYYFGKRHDTEKETELPVKLLPAYDEYVLGYSDRGHLFVKDTDKSVIHSNGVFKPTLVIDGKVAGTWRSKPLGKETSVFVKPFRTLQRSEKDGLKEAALEYGNFLERSVSLKMQ